MLNLKKYANGRFFDTDNKKFIKVEKLGELIQKGEKIKVIFTKTGKDITDSVIAQFTKKEAPKAKKVDKKKAGKKSQAPFIKTDSLKKWAGKIIDKRISEVLDIIKLPTREQTVELDANIKALNKKIDKLKALEKKKNLKAGPLKKAAVAPGSKAKEENPKEEQIVKEK
ncbi:MAG: hypothetical protein JRI38_02335 [Deltaproteobacteria bacterium]|nr:hypothetical protein [Deltaproteobacteria bacterium]